MPNGGSENCGECYFFNKNQETIISEGFDRFRIPHCTLRRIIIAPNPFWIYCENFSPDYTPEKVEPLGHVYADAGTYPYSRKVLLTESQQNFLNEEQEKLADFLRKNVELDNPDVGDEFSYQNLPLCVIDAIFSINTNYASTNKVIERCKSAFFKNEDDVFENRKGKLNPSFTVNRLIAFYENNSIDYMADKVYKNRQRTSPINGILKAEAVLRFCKALNNFGVNKLEEIGKIIGNTEFENEIKNIPGQRSGISLSYFYILAGAKDYVKPDRMIKKILTEVLNRKVSTKECHSLIFGSSLILEKEFPLVRACVLDNLMWKLQSGRK
ncbi:MAG: hypothetical protein RBR20_04740 [Desulfobacterales bacterium]|nr:hypothetical protein [Desulfobacterales bacterium]